MALRAGGSCRSARRRRAAPAISAGDQRRVGAGEGEHGAVVDRVGVAVEQRVRGRELRRRSRRSPPRRDPRRSSGPRAPSLKPPPAPLRRAARRRATSRSPSTRHVGLMHDAVEVDRHLDGARRSPPRRRRRRGRCRAASRPRAALPVSFAFSLVPIPSSATLVPCSPPRGEQLEQRARPPAPPAAVRRPPSTSSSTGSGTGRRRRSSRRRPACPRRSPSIGRDEALAAGQVAEGARRAQVAGVGDRRRGRRGRAAGRVPLAQVIRASEPALSAPAIAAPRRRSVVHVGAHHPGEHLLGDAGEGRDPRAGLGGGVARRRVRERLHGRSEDDVGRAHRRGDRCRAARRRGPRARPSGARTASAPTRPASPRRRSPSPIVAGLAITRTSSPSPTPRQSRTTVLIARSRSLTRPRLPGAPAAII